MVHGWLLGLLIIAGQGFVLHSGTLFPIHNNEILCLMVMVVMVRVDYYQNHRHHNHHHGGG